MGINYWFISKEKKVQFYLGRNILIDNEYKEVSSKFDKLMEQIESESESFDDLKLDSITIGHIRKLVNYYKDLEYLSFNRPDIAIIYTYLIGMFPDGIIVADTSDMEEYKDYTMYSD